MIELSRSIKTQLPDAPDGRKRYAINASVNVIQMKEDGGVWEDIDPTLDDKGIPKTVPYDLIPYLTGMPGFHYKSKQSGEFDVRLREARLSSISITPISPKPNCKPVIEGRTIKWVDYYPDVDIVLTMGNTCVILERIIKSASAPLEFDVDITEAEKGVAQLRPIQPATDAEGQLIKMEEKPCLNGRTETLKLEVIEQDGEKPKPIAYPIRDSTIIDDQPVVAQSDDGECRGDGLYVDIIRTTIRMASNAADSIRYWGGMRWEVAIPQGAIINVCHGNWYIYSTTHDANFNIHFEYGASPATIDDGDPDNILTRSRTSSSVPWIEDNVAAAGVGWYHTPSLVDPLQEVADDFTTSYIFLLTRPNENLTKSFTPNSYDYNDHSRAPEIYIEYTLALAVTTQIVVDITGGATATGHGNITSLGADANADKKGFVYGTTSHGDPGGTAPGVSDYDTHVEDTDGFPTGAFNKTLTGLIGDETYYVRAYAHGSTEGYAYGNEVSFLNEEAPPPIELIGTASDNTDNETSVVVNVSGIDIQDGDLILFFGSCDGLGYALPANFIELHNVATPGAHKNILAYKIADSEPSEYTVETAVTGERGIAIFAVYRGVDPDDPIDASNSNTGGSNITGVITAITPTNNYSAVAVFIGLESGNAGDPIIPTIPGWPSSLVEQLDNVNGPPGTGGASSAGAYADEIQLSKAEVSGNITLDGGVTNWGVMAVVLNILEEVGPEVIYQSVGEGSITPVGAINRIIKIVMGSGSITPVGALGLFIKIVTGSGAITPTGTLTAIKKFLQTIGEGSITPTGTLTTIRNIFQSVGSGAITPIGALNRVIKLLVGEGSITPTGTLTAIKRFFQNTGQGAVTAIGGLNRKILLTIGQGAITPTGALNRVIKLLVGEGAIAPTGTLSTVLKFFVSVGQGSITAIGTLNRIIKLTIGSGAIAPIGALGRKIMLTVGSGSVTPSGALSTIKKFIQSVGEGAVTPIGTLGRKIMLTVGSGAITPTGALNRLIKLLVGLGAIIPSGILSIFIAKRWLSGYTFRKKITLTGSADGNKTNYQLWLDVNFGAGTDSGLTVYCHECCNIDFDDIRFTKSDGDTELDYWREEKTDSDDATFVVEFDSMAGSPATTTFYMYFGKTGDSTTSDIASTFIKGDDFEWGNDGDPIEDDGGSIDWTEETAEVDIDTGQDIGDEAGFTGTRSMQHCDGSDALCPVTVSANIAIRWRTRKDDQTEWYFQHGNGTSLVYLRVDDEGNIYSRDSELRDTGYNTTAYEWGLFELSNFDWVSYTFDIWFDGVKIADDVGMRPEFATYPNQMRFGHNGVGYGWNDDVIVRNWTANEPTITAWGALEFYVGEGAITPIGVLNRLIKFLVGGGSITPVGTLAGFIFIRFFQNVGQGAITAVGTLAWMFKMAVGSGAITPTGALNRVIKLLVGGGSVTPVGTLAGVIKFFQSVGQGVITPIGTLGRKIKLAVGSGAVTPIGALTTIKRILQSVGAGAITPIGTLGRKIKLLVGEGAITPVGTLAKTLVVKFFVNVGQGTVAIAGALNRKIKLTIGQGAITPVGTLAWGMVRNLILKVNEGNIYRMVVNEGVIYRLKNNAGNIYRLVINEGMIYRLKTIAGKIYRMITKEG